MRVRAAAGRVIRMRDGRREHESGGPQVSEWLWAAVSTCARLGAVVVVVRSATAIKRRDTTDMACESTQLRAEND